MTSQDKKTVDKKVHFATDAEYPHESGWCLALCMTQIEEAVALSVWDNLPVGTSLDLRSINAIGTCSKCVRHMQEWMSGRKTIYAIKSARALKVVTGQSDEDQRRKKGMNERG